MLLSCPDCLLECTLDEQSADTFSCPSCGLLLYSRSGGSGALLAKPGAAIELSADDLDRTRQWHASLDEILPTPEQLPRRLGRYELTELLGEGSFAQVYRAVDSELGRDVALKIPSKRRFSSPEHLSRFVSEARTAAKLEHPGIVRVYDISWLSNDVCFIAMEHCPGGSLDQLLKAGSISQRRTAEIIADAAEAMHFAHLKGLVHRDLKPSNIMFGCDGRTRIVDFGLALPEEQRYDRVGEIAGTLPYMSPEQARGETQHLDGRSDIWSLGIILYQMLTGRRPFIGNRQQLSAEILNHEPKPPRQVVEDVSKELEEICLKCLAKPITARWSTAHDISEALNAWLATHRSISVGLAAPTVAAPQANAQRWVPMALLLCLLLVVVPLGVFAAMSLTPRPGARMAVPEFDPNWLEKQPLLKQVSLLNHAPKKLAWPANPSTEILTFDLAQESLSVDSRQMTLIELGHTNASEFILDAQFSKNVPVGWSGFFWGYQADPNDPLLGNCHAIYYRNVRGNDGTPIWSLELSYLTFKRLRSGSVINLGSNGTVGAAIDPPQRGSSRLEIRIENPSSPALHPTAIKLGKPPPISTGLLSVVWNGREIDALSQHWAEYETSFNKVARPQDPPFQKIRASGSFGILNYWGSTTVRNAHITLQRRPQR